MTTWLALGLGMALAQEGGRPITYEEALTTAVENNPTLATARMARLQADGTVKSAQGQFDPTYTLDGSYRRSTNQGFFQGFPFSSRSQTYNINNQLAGTLGTGTSYALNAGIDRNLSTFVTEFVPGQGTEQEQDVFTSNMNVSVTQQLLEGVLYRYNVQNVTRARQQLSNAELGEAKATQDALYTAAEAYWSWVYAIELQRIAEESVSVAEEALRVGRLQVENGTLAPVEGTRLEAALVQSQQASLDAQNTAEQASNALLLALGESPDQAIVPATPAGDVPPEELDVAAATEVAMVQNVDLMVSRANVELARFDLGNAKHALLPSLAATGAAGVAAQDNSAGSAIGGLTDDDNQPFLSIAGQLTVPLGNRSARGNLDTNAAVVSQRERELADLERSVRAQVEQQVFTLRSARRRMELADANLRLATQTLEAEEALASAGRNIQRDVLQARTEVDRAKADAAKARTDYRLAQAQLLRLQGQLDRAAQ